MQKNGKKHLFGGRNVLFYWKMIIKRFSEFFCIKYLFIHTFFLPKPAFISETHTINLLCAFKHNTHFLTFFHSNSSNFTKRVYYIVASFVYVTFCNVKSILNLCKSIFRCFVMEMNFITNKIAVSSLSCSQLCFSSNIN